MITWETPSFIEVEMSAEIGGYQGDEDPRPDHMPDFVESTSPSRNTAPRDASPRANLGAPALKNRPRPIRRPHPQ
jgi:hypothetical protein